MRIRTGSNAVGVPRRTALTACRSLLAPPLAHLYAPICTHSCPHDLRCPPGLCGPAFVEGLRRVRPRMPPGRAAHPPVHEAWRAVSAASSSTPARSSHRQTAVLPRAAMLSDTHLMSNGARRTSQRPRRCRCSHPRHRSAHRSPRFRPFALVCRQRELTSIEALRVTNEAKELMLNPPFIGGARQSHAVTSPSRRRYVAFTSPLRRRYIHDASS